MFAPERFDCIEPIHQAVPLEHEKRKQCARLQAAQLAGALPTIEPDGELSAQLNPVPAGHASDRPAGPLLPPAQRTRGSQCLRIWELILRP